MKLDKYIGMDVHQATTVVVVLNADGKGIFETIAATEGTASVGVSRARWNADAEGIGPRLRNTFDRHRADDGTD